MRTKNYYINGNTVREVQDPAERQWLDPDSRQQIKKRKARKSAARRNRERELSMTGTTVFFLAICTAIVALAGGYYVKLQAEVSSRMKNVAALEASVEDLRADNDEQYKRITTSVDLNEVKDIAMNQLGMTYPSQEQVVYYSVENSNFMDQYSNIPQ